MANKFEKAKSVQVLQDVAKESNARANLITIRYFKNEQLLDYPRNNEDITDTGDIEMSIREQGFTDPIEITDFGCDEGKYYIVSGHRRRSAGVKAGLKEFPCIVRHFRTDTEVYNYVLYSNAQRDSAKDPLLLARRYKMHEEYLKESGFKGSMAEEIARRLGLQKAQADRYKAMNRVILPVWDMVREGKIGMSSITDSGFYTHTPTEQTEILMIFEECIGNAVELTRGTVTRIVKSYREGKRSWLEVIQIGMEEAQKSIHTGNTVNAVGGGGMPGQINDVDAGSEEAVAVAENKRQEENGKKKGLQEKKNGETTEHEMLKVGDEIVRQSSRLVTLFGKEYSFETDEKKCAAVGMLEEVIKAAREAIMKLEK